MANIMAKTEFNNLRILDYYGINVPKVFEYRNGLIFSMQMIPFTPDSDFEPAPLLKEINLTKYTDPGSFLELILDEVEKMFKEALMVHGDLSEFNILVSQSDDIWKPYIIDVSQSRLYNNKTFTTTPVRIRLDNALKVVIRDLDKILNHFETKYKIYFSREDVFSKMFCDLPNFAKERKLLDKENLFQQKPSKTAWMSSNEVNSYTNKRMHGKDKKMQNLFESLN